MLLCVLDESHLERQRFPSAIHTSQCFVYCVILSQLSSPWAENDVPTPNPAGITHTLAVNMLAPRKNLKYLSCRLHHPQLPTTAGCLLQRLHLRKKHNGPQVMTQLYLCLWTLGRKAGESWRYLRNEQPMATQIAA